MTMPQPSDDRFVLRLRAGRTEVAILPLDASLANSLEPEGRAQVQAIWKCSAIQIIAQALDDPQVRLALRDRGLHLVVAK